MRSKHWDDMVDIVDNLFPKGEVKERGRALVVLAYIEMLLQGYEFKNGEPVTKNATQTP